MSTTFEKQMADLNALNIFNLDEYNIDRCRDVQKIAEEQSSVAGNMAQCGVCWGLTAYFMTKNCNEQIFLFDSWQGLPKISEKDNDYYFRGMWKSESKYAEKTLAEFSNTRFFGGWLPDTLIIAPEAKYSMVHIDLDLYEGTLGCLKYFWDRMSPGGVIMIDHHKDFATGVLIAIEEFFGHKDFPNTPSGQMLIYKPVD